MIGTTPSTAFESTRTVRNDHDASWYGTLAVLAACLGVLAAACFVG